MVRIDQEENWTDMALWIVMLAVAGCAALLTSSRTAHAQAVQMLRVAEGEARVRKTRRRQVRR